MKAMACRHIWRVTSLALVGVLASCGPRTSSVVDGKVWKELAGECYRIPIWNMRRESNWGPSRAVTLLFSNVEIKQRIETYEIPLMVNRQPLDGTGVLTWIPRPPELEQIHVNKRLRARELHDLWFAKGESTRRKIEPAPEPGLYRVYRLPPGPTYTSWQLIDTMPDPGLEATLSRDISVAECGKESDQPQSNCAMQLEYGSFEFEIWTTEHNIALREQLGGYFVSKLNEWKVSCDERDR